MRYDHPRRHLPHYEVPDGTSHITWRLHRSQVVLTPEERSVVLETLRRDHNRRCKIHASVIMDDHVHILLRANEGVATAQLAQAWKSISSRRIINGSARTAPLWQAEYYQRWLASPRLIDICAAYIRQNPQRKWPEVEEYAWVL